MRRNPPIFFHAKRKETNSCTLPTRSLCFFKCETKQPLPTATAGLNVFYFACSGTPPETCTCMFSCADTSCLAVGVRCELALRLFLAPAPLSARGFGVYRRCNASRGAPGLVSSPTHAAETAFAEQKVAGLASGLSHLSCDRSKIRSIRGCAAQQPSRKQHKSA